MSAYQLCTISVDTGLGKDFIKQFLDPEATTRLSISEARTHPWMHESKEDLEQLWERVVLGGEVVGLGSKA